MRLHQVEKELRELKQDDSELLLEMEKRDRQAVDESCVNTKTGLPTYQVFEDRLEQAIVHNKRNKGTFALISIDIDKFRDINKLSYPIGDSTLIEFATRLQRCIRQVDTVAHFAGDNFLIILPRLSRPETAAYIAHRVQDCLVEPFKIEEHEFYITVSMGIVVYPNDGLHKKQLMENVEVALRKAKTQGGNCYQFYQEDIQALGQRELSLASCIRSPNLRDNLVIEYQPYYYSDRNEIAYMQATPILNHPKLGKVAFPDFSQIAENSGKIVEIGFWVLESAIEQCRIWSQEGLQIPRLAVNVTFRQLENPTFVTRLDTLLKSIYPKKIQLIIEIIDDSLPINTLFLEKVFTALNDMGVQVVVGLMTLSHFSTYKAARIPIHYLKINKNLVQTSIENTQRSEVIQNLIILAKLEKMIILAEGVDTVSQKKILTEFGCDYVSGKSTEGLAPDSISEKST